MEEGTSTPVLRFCGFSEDWRIVRLGSVLTILNGFAFSSSHAVESGVRWVKIADVGIHKMKKDNLSYLPVSFTRSHSKFILKKGDCVIALTRPILNSRLKIAMIDDEFDGALLNQRVGKIITSNHLPFIYYLLQQDRLVTIIESNIAGSDPPNLSPNEINGIQVTVPILAEQQKIAAFLTAVDNKIQLLEKKKGLLEQYKKGVMQKIFSQEIRFKDDHGKDYPDWKEGKLADVGIIIGGGTPDTSIESYWRGEINWFTPTELKSKYVESSVRRISQQGLINSSAKLLPQGAVLLSSRATVGDVSIALTDCCTNQGFQSIVVSKSNVNEFVYYWLKLNKHQLLKNASGSTFLEISKAELGKLKINVPSLQEQTKVANFLSAIDDKIKYVTTQIALTREYKKGLLQQMFV
ncbi:MAG: restriction endonuclease subunit S [Arcticibacter sp.]